jgi:hypothetical protein
MKRKRPMLTSAGGTREWRVTTATFVSQPGNQLCWLRFPKCTLRATTIDHYWPRKFRPDLADVPGNWRPACLSCNRTRRHTPPHLIPQLRAKLEAQMGRARPSKALGFFR